MPIAIGEAPGDLPGAAWGVGHDSPPGELA
jgi:hypothetical protein